MARSTAEIQADIAVTRRQIERQLDGLRRRVPDRWWTPYAMLAGALVVLVAAAFAPLFGAAWQHLVIAGGGIVLLAVGAIAWSAWRLTHLSWPKETVASFQENWRWLGAQLRSRLRLR